MTVDLRKFTRNNWKYSSNHFLLSCDGLEENGLQGSIYLNVWAPVTGTGREGLEGITFLKDMCQ